MKSKKLKYEQAVARALPNLKNNATVEVLRKYEDIDKVKKHLGIRANDKSHDKEILAALK